ncbi:MAG: hypothetical protein AB1477_03840 [Acidobacteriota bacterium]
MIVYLHSAEKAKNIRTFDRHRRSDVRHIVLPKGPDIRLIAEFVVSHFSDEEKQKPEGLIELLVINSDGTGGETYIGGADAEGSIIYIGNAFSFGRSFARLLAPPRKGGQGIEIHGAAAAAPERDPRSGNIVDPNYGLKFIFALACGFNSRVRASCEPQVSGNEEFFGETLAEAYPGDGDWEDHVFVRPGQDNPGNFASRRDAILTGKTITDIRRLPI